MPPAIATMRVLTKDNPENIKNVSSRRRVLSDAYEAGQEAGRKFEVKAGIE